MAAKYVEIRSKEMIKPSSPTPNHLRYHKLSSLDQGIPPSYIPVIFFYKSNHPELQESLKKSLSNVLTEFYLLAGRLSRERSTVDCNDLGALFVESNVEGNMVEVITDPTVEELRKYLPPVESSNLEDDGAIVLGIQTSVFDCGGIAVAVQMHHMVGDANSIVYFLNAWAAATRGGGDRTFSPMFDMASIFPPKDMPSSGISGSEPPVTEKTVIKRLVFDKRDLENLKLQATSEVIKDPTRVEAVSSFLLKHFRAASIARGCKKQLALILGVNLRPRMDPPLPSQAFGNVISGAVAHVDDADVDLAEVLRKEIRIVNADFVKQIQEDVVNMKDVIKHELWTLTSWTRFPLYQVDYGWGRPIWVSPIPTSDKNFVVLFSTSSEDGIEAWVHLLEEDAAFIDFSLL